MAELRRKKLLARSTLLVGRRQRHYGVCAAVEAIFLYWREESIMKGQVISGAGRVQAGIILLLLLMITDISARVHSTDGVLFCESSSAKEVMIFLCMKRIVLTRRGEGRS